jgi:hypothetical protein
MKMTLAWCVVPELSVAAADTLVRFCLSFSEACATKR